MSGFDDILKAAPAEERAIVEKYLRAFAAELEADVAIISRSAQAAREELAAARAKLAASEEAEKARKGSWLPRMPSWPRQTPPRRRRRWNDWRTPSKPE